ncbi:MAG: UvrD-helicase domain-containing protein [Prevotella sp.]|nr:UvrD-helicase domain-containing protein [Prevotella sp.]
MSKLTIYKASAGSGKTHRLAMEIIKRLVVKPTAYREILAVTFTNKATEEMKQRVLTHLYGIWKGLSGSRVFAADVERELRAEHHFSGDIGERAGMALALILHDYHHLCVETIDAFFQRILRELTRELDLATGLKIELGDKLAVRESVDLLMGEMKPNTGILKWILELVNEQMDEDRSWNVAELVKSFGENILKDFYKEKAGQLSEILNRKAFFQKFTETLRSLRRDARQAITDFAGRFERIMAEEGMDMDCFANGKSGIAGYFLKLTDDFADNEKMLGKRVVGALESRDPEAWLRKSDLKQHPEWVGTVKDRLLPLLVEAETTRKRQLRTYKSADLTLRHLYKLRLLGSIEKKVRERNEELNRFLLSDTCGLLGGLIATGDAPFIFEKTGGGLSHIMIDEFQDTSRSQWHTFKVLLDECLSHHGNTGLIVGDVKQSIYRWRSGDWRLLADIRQEMSGTTISEEQLGKNYRSEGNIIAFNNQFFALAANLEYLRLKDVVGEDKANQLKRAYQEVEQQYPKEKPWKGEITVALLPGKSKDASTTYEEQTLALTKERIKTLLDNGAEPSEIAVLARSNRTIEKLVQYLQQELPTATFVSDEAFRLDSSAAVNILINALRLTVQEDNQIARAVVEKYEGTGVRVYEGARLGFSLAKLSSLPLYDLAWCIFAELRLDRFDGESAFVCAFFDELAKFIQDRNIPDVKNFLSYWDDTLYSKTIQSDNTTGIRLLTIHKSKGLEFPHVLLPFCDWQLEKTYTLWCEPTEAPYNQLPVVPVDFSAKGMKDSIYEDAYWQEHLQNTVDNLNLLYVAFTRASKSLYVIGKQNDKNSRSHLIEEVMESSWEESQGLPPVLSPLPERDSEWKIWQMGSLEKTIAAAPRRATEEASVKIEGSSSINVFTQEALPVRMDIKPSGRHFEFLQSNQSQKFLSADEDTKDNTFIQLGSLLHHVLSNIRTLGDAEPAIRQLETEGVLPDGDIRPDKLIAMLRERLHHPQVAEWFAPRWKVHNECNIIYTDPDTGEPVNRRPDRVMTDGQQTIVVDFKFATPSPEHHRQVALYTGLLREMGYTNVSGYLWYVYRNQVVDV